MEVWLKRKKVSWRWVVGWEAISLACHLPLPGKEREAILPEEMPFIKADKTNRASFPVAMVLKARLIM